jgi:hypothetical protein
VFISLIRYVSMLLLFCFVGTVGAQVRYDFTGPLPGWFSSPTPQASFTLMTPDYLVATPNGYEFPVGSQGLSSFSIDFLPKEYVPEKVGFGFGTGKDTWDSIGIWVHNNQTGGGYGFGYFFEKGAFSSLGTHATIWGEQGSLTVTAVPEPETYAMLLVGLGLMGAIARRRNQSQA